ncbi:hypothetical protein [Streptomyces sp. SID3343]|uniref:hypothetical protein n=1 Tax=Streptomyces sp. SID3343 TaxID=2690260 RepID=UPI0019252A1C
MAKIEASAEPEVFRAAGAGGPAGSESPAADRERLFALLPELAVCEAVFLPADPPLSGRMAFWTFGGEPPDLGAQPEDLTVVRPRGSSVSRVRVTAVPLPVEQALPLLTRCRAIGADGGGRVSGGTVSGAGIWSSISWWMSSRLSTRTAGTFQTC